MAVIGPFVAVLAKRATELRDHDHDGLAPVGAELVGQRHETPAQAVEVAGQHIPSADGGFYRIHSNTAGQSYGGDANSTGICQQNDDTSQIGCLKDSDPCSVGYAGRGAAQAFAGNITAPTEVSESPKALAVNGTPPFTPGADPDLAVTNLLQPAGTLPLYRLSRRL